jgi:hypothetical protein
VVTVIYPTIRIQTIPHDEHRYETVGDYFYPDSPENKYMEVRVSKMGNPDYEFLVSIHEQIEAYLCEKRGISEESITKFDKNFESFREEGNTAEPGFDPSAPYVKEHAFATKIEIQLAEELGVDWDEYEKVINSL